MPYCQGTAIPIKDEESFPFLLAYIDPKRKDDLGTQKWITETLEKYEIKSDVMFMKEASNTKDSTRLRKINM